MSLSIFIPGCESFNEATNEFVYTDSTVLHLEHSLMSIAKWESKWKKPFLSDKPKTREESIDYVKCMTIKPVKDPSVYQTLSRDAMDKINAYIEDSMTATWFSDKGPKENRPYHKKEIITAEIIYYWMVSLQIPFECQEWHLNRLLTLIRVCNIKNQPAKKMSKRDALKSQAAVNRARRAKLNSGV